ncbi:MAG: hypothetical protein M0P22_05180, partial [Methanoculleus sp.]|nr:hypothetical protein [Methanoculleus sp.]
DRVRFIPTHMGNSLPFIIPGRMYPSIRVAVFEESPSATEGYTNTLIPYHITVLVPSGVCGHNQCERLRQSVGEVSGPVE